MVKAFAAGINDFIRLHRAQLLAKFPASAEILDRPVTEEDVISAYFAFVIRSWALKLKALAHGKDGRGDLFSTEHPNE